MPKKLKDRIRKIPFNRSELAYNPDMTLKKINKHIYDWGFKLIFLCFDRRDHFVYYRFLPLGNYTPLPVGQDEVGVYHLGDYTEEEWAKKLKGLLKQAGMFNTAERRYLRARRKKRMMGLDPDRYVESEFDGRGKKA